MATHNRGMEYTLLPSYTRSTGRIPALDRFRGLSLWLMFAFGAAKMVTFCDFFVRFSTHDVALSWQLIRGYGFYDSIAPLFVFASGLAFWAAFRSRQCRVGTSQAILSSARRGLQLVGIGGLLAFDFADPLGWVLFALAIGMAVTWLVSCLRPAHSPLLRRWMGRVLLGVGAATILANYIEIMFYLGGTAVWNAHWSAIASIGVGLLVTLALVRLPTWGRVLACIGATVFYALACRFSPAGMFDGFVHGGLAGSMGYALLVMYAYTLMSMGTDRWLRLMFGALLWSMGLVACIYLDPAKEAVNISYVLVSFAIAYDVYAVVRLFDGLSCRRFAPLTILGRTSLTVYCLHFVLTFPFGICLDALVSYVPVGTVLRCILFVLGMIGYPFLMALLARALSRRHCLIRL